MRWIGFTLLVFLTFPSISNAAYTYIKVTKTKNINQLNSIKSNLKRLGQTSTHRTTKTGYVIYSGPYKNSTSAKYTLKKIKRFFPYATIVKTKTKPTTKKVIKRKTTKTPKQKQKFFVGGALGYSKSVLTYTGGTKLDYPPKETGISYDLHLGYNFKKDMFITLGYLRTDTSDIVFDNFYSSLNYKFVKFDNLSPYFGLLAGYSKLTWNKAPIANATSKSSVSDSFFGGTQVGVIYDGYESFSLYANYQCLFVNHSTAINVSDKLEHKTLNNIQLGVQYSF